MITLLFRGLVLLWCYFLTLTLSKKSTGLFVCEFQENLPGQRNQLSQSAQGWGYSRDTRLPMSGKAWENQDRSVTNSRLHLMILRNQLLYSWHLQNLCIRWVVDRAKNCRLEDLSLAASLRASQIICEPLFIICEIQTQIAASHTAQTDCQDWESWCYEDTLCITK